jgi:parvulin-like peptidyl-prolyl isomerase
MVKINIILYPQNFLIMKFIHVLFLLFFSNILFGQNIDKKLEKISNLKQANAFLKSNKSVFGFVYQLNSVMDSLTLLDFPNIKAGQIIRSDSFIYKIIDEFDIMVNKVSYIYLNGAVIDKNSIDSLRKVIILKYNNGTVFEDLAEVYNMDSNESGILGWFTDGMMVKKFESDIKSKSLNSIFTVDIPENNWYYVVLKTNNERVSKSYNVLKITK